MTNSTPGLIAKRTINSNTAQPTLSVIVPVYNTRDYLVETLQSIASSAEQELEIIIVNDGSTDDSDHIIQDWMRSTKIETTYIVQSNQGLSLARMSGISNARGRYLVFCDSDDLLDMDTVLQLAALMDERSTDLGIFRSCVFEHLSGESYDFYDWAIWDSLLVGKPYIETTPQRAPQLLRLEPNANTRIYRRDYFAREGITFPSGLHFEDLPAHTEALVSAKSIVCLNKTGYFYRVNRPGKITDQKSEKRFDILTSTKLAIDALINRKANTEIQAWTILLASRMIYWCGKNTLNKDRIRFFESACELISSKAPKEAVGHAIRTANSVQESILLAALAANSSEFLARHASGLKPRARDAIGLFARSPHKKELLKITKSTVKKVAKSRATRLAKH